MQFYGFAANPFAIMARATALCSPSRFEGFPLTTTEGAALGIPVIATACPYGPPEILEDGRYGALIPTEDVAALAAAMRAHLVDPAPLRQKAAASFAARARLSAERCHAQYEALFEAMLEDRPARKATRRSASAGWRV